MSKLGCRAPSLATRKAPSTTPSPLSLVTLPKVRLLLTSNHHTIHHPPSPGYLCIKLGLLGHHFLTSFPCLLVWPPLAAARHRITVETDHAPKGPARPGSPTSASQPRRDLPSPVADVAVVLGCVTGYPFSRSSTLHLPSACPSIDGSFYEAYPGSHCMAQHFAAKLAAVNSWTLTNRPLP